MVKSLIAAKADVNFVCKVSYHVYHVKFVIRKNLKKSLSFK